MYTRNAYLEGEYRLLCGTAYDYLNAGMAPLMNKRVVPSYFVEISKHIVEDKLKFNKTNMRGRKDKLFG